MSDLHTILGVNDSATIEQIKTAYRKMAVLHHPDRPGGSHDRMVRINQAYELLTHTKHPRIIWAKDPAQKREERYEQNYGPWSPSDVDYWNNKQVPLKDRVLNFFEWHQTRKFDQQKILSKARWFFNISYPNVYYYWARVYKKTG